MAQKVREGQEGGDGPLADAFPSSPKRSGPTIAGGERSEPPFQSAGRGPGETKPLATMTAEAESASGSCGDAEAGVGAAVH